jgi:hypothetical protein
MPTALIKPKSYLRVRYHVPHRRLIDYTVEADRPVDTYILDDEGLNEFLGKGEDVYSYYGGFYNRYKHHQELRLPFQGWWYLVIDNQNREPVAVHYEVSG